MLNPDEPMDFEAFVETLDFDNFPPIENAYHHENEGCYTGDSRHTNVIATMVSGLGLVNIVDIQAADQAQALLQLASEITPRIHKDDGIYTSKQSNTGNQNFSASRQPQTNGFTIEKVRSIETKDPHFHLADITEILCQKKDGEIRAVMAICYVVDERQSRINPFILFVDAATQIVRLGHHFPMNLEHKSLLHITDSILARIQTLRQIMPESGWTKAPVKNKR